MLQLLKIVQPRVLAAWVTLGVAGAVWPSMVAAESEPVAAVAPVEAASGFTLAELAVVERDASKVTAHEMVGQVSDRVMDIIRQTNAGTITQEQANTVLNELMSDVIDFRYIVLNVMGRKAATAASREQLQRFVKVFKEGLIGTYSKGMTSFTDNTVTVLPPKGDTSTGKTVTVYQEISSDSGDLVVSYSVAADKTQHWVLRNVVLSGVNLGKQFRSQFRSAMKQSGNDLETVIANWNS